jgi:hypothetical protein
MEPEQQTNNQESPAEAKPVASGTRDNRRRPDPRRGGRFRRDDRGGRNDRGGRPGPGPGPGQGDQAPVKGSGTIRDAMQHVEHIRNELRNVLEEMQEVTRILDQVEREKTASEDEIEQLRDSLRGLHRDSGSSRYGRTPPPSRPITPREPAPEPEPAAEEPAREED